MLFGQKKKQPDSWVRVYQGTGPTDAYLVRDWLARNHVPAQVRGESLMSIRGEVPVWEAWPSVWSPGELTERARELIEAFYGPTLVHPEWQCPRCSETNAPNFASCWSCGTDRPPLPPPEPDLDPEPSAP